VKLCLPDWTGDGHYYVTMLKAAAVCVMQLYICVSNTSGGTT